MAVDVPALSNKIYGLHQIAAQMTGLPFAAISEQESNALAVAVADLGKYYDLSFDSPYFAIASLLGVAGMIYIPRAMIIMQMRKAAKAARPAMAAHPSDVGPSPTNIYNFGEEKHGE